MIATALNAWSAQSRLARSNSSSRLCFAELFGETSIDRSALDEVADVLGQPGALDLLAAYVSLPPEADRTALVNFLQSATS